MRTPIEMPVAVRAWAPRDKHSKPRGRAFTDIGPSAWTLTFDTETTLDAGQALRVGAFELRRAIRLVTTGLFYEPDALTDDELSLLEEYTAVHGLALMTRAEFVDDVFLPTAWDRRGLIIGHNLPFDISRVSMDHHPPQSRGGMMRGGFAFKLSANENASRVQVKRSNAGAAFIRLTIPGGISPEARNRQRGGKQKNHHGYFLDTATLGGAMLGERPSLKRLAELLGTEHRKIDAEHGEKITAEYLDYLRNDVLVTWECWRALRARYDRYELPVEPWQIYSEASIGKAHMKSMQLTPFRALNDWPDPILATVMETYYGGRTECKIRRMPVPGVYVDFASQYPTVFALQELHCYLTAEQITYEREDPQRVQQLLDDLTADQVLEQPFWCDELHALVRIAPDADRLPTRARYSENRDRAKRKGSYNVGVPYRHGGPPQWYTMADACASKLMTGRAPQIVGVLRFTPEGTQAAIGPIAIAGNPDYIVDPGREDFIRRLVELRIEVRRDLKHAESAGDASRAAALEATQQAMKITANATSYGSTIELNPVEHRKGAWVTVHLPDGTSYRLHQDRIEEPGTWFHPVIGTLVTGGGRLLLATAMALLDDQGGSYAFCDTDSLFVVANEHGKLIPCPGGKYRTPTGQAAIKAISWPEAHTIAERFTALDPYQRHGGPQSILELEAENYDPKTGRQREIECYAIASKRYGLFTRRTDRTPAIITVGNKQKRSGHGLGHLLPPNAPNPDIRDRAWLDQWWEHLLHLELGFLDHPEPTWFDEPAVGRLTVTSQRDIKAFKTYNQARPYAQQVKPWNFLTIAHPTTHERARADGPTTLIAPFERDPVKRLQADWIDRDKPNQLTSRIYTSTTPAYREGKIAIVSYRDYFNRYRQHPESKALDPTDGRRCHPWTRGELQPSRIKASGQTRIGKESNRFTDSHVPTDSEDERVIDYGAPERRCRGCDAVVTGKRHWCSEACRKRHGRETLLPPKLRTPSHS